MSDQLREAAQAALEAVETVLNDAYHRRFPECCGRPQGYECCGDWNEAMTPDDNRIMDLLSPVQRQLSETLRAALAEPDAKTVAWIVESKDCVSRFTLDQPEFVQFYLSDPDFRVTPLYTQPPCREWQGLTDEEIELLERQYAGYDIYRAIEVKLKEKNHD